MDKRKCWSNMSVTILNYLDFYSISTEYFTHVWMRNHHENYFEVEVFFSNLTYDKKVLPRKNNLTV